MEKIGNKVANDFWEYKMPVGYRKPTVSSTQFELEKFVQEKYMKRAFAPPDFIDPVTEFLEARKNGVPMKQSKFFSFFLKKIKQIFLNIMNYFYDIINKPTKGSSESSRS